MTSSSYYKADSAKDIQEIIESEANITPIKGRPDCHTLIQLLNQLCKGAREVSCDYSAYGLMWLCLPQPIYYALTRENVVAPMQPPQTPPYNPEGTATENALITIQWQKNKELWDQMQNANKALINAAKGALNEESRDALTNLFVGTAYRNFFLFFDGLYTKWGKATPVDIKKNNDNMYKPWDPAVQDISALLRQIRTAYLLSAFVNHEKSEKDMVTAGENLILETHQFTREYAEWRKIPEADRTWRKFEEFWTDAFSLWLETSRTAASMGFGGNVEEVADEEKAFLDSINQFSAANVHNSQTFEALSQANAQMANNMAAQIQQLSKQMESLAMAVNQQPPAQQSYVPQAPPPPPQYYAPPPPPAMPSNNYGQYQQQAPYQQQGQYQYQGYGGRGGRGGRGRGRGYSRGRGGRGAGQSQYYQQGGYQGQQGNTHQAPASGGFYDGQNRAPNPVKYHKNWWYCWSHGYDVDHDSAHCPNPRAGHVSYATRDNPCNGCMKAKHKTQM